MVLPGVSDALDRGVRAVGIEGQGDFDAGGAIGSAFSNGSARRIGDRLYDLFGIRGACRDGSRPRPCNASSFLRRIMASKHLPVSSCAI